MRVKSLKANCFWKTSMATQSTNWTTNKNELKLVAVSIIMSEARNKNQLFKMKSKASKAKRRSKPKFKGCYVKHRKKKTAYNFVNYKNKKKRKWHTMVYIHCLKHILQLEKSSSREETHTMWSFYHQSPKQVHYTRILDTRIKDRIPKAARFRGLLMSSTWIYQRRHEKNEYDSDNLLRNVI